jgi:hypothetical protein
LYRVWPTAADAIMTNGGVPSGIEPYTITPFPRADAVRYGGSRDPLISIADTTVPPHLEGVTLNVKRIAGQATEVR